MAKVYADLVMKGIKTMDEVPARLKEQVAQIVADAIQSYAEMVYAGEITLMNVPVGIRAQVQEAVEAMDVEPEPEDENDPPIVGVL